MKILFVLPEFGEQVQGGIARFYQHAISSLVEAGCEVTVCVANTSAIEPQAGLTIFNITAESVAAQFEQLSQFHLVPGLRWQLAVAQAAFDRCEGGEGYDVVETTDWGFLYAPWLSRRPRKAPVVVQLHGSPGQIDFKDPIAGFEAEGLITRAIELSLLPRADSLQTPGPANAREWANLLERVVTHLPPAWAPAPEGDGAPEEHYGLVASRLQDWKGPEVLCRAARRLGAEAPMVQWVGGDHVHGSLESPMSEYLRKTYPDVWGSSVLYFGGKPPHTLKALRQRAKFILHPSTWDCFPLAVVEAMDAGKTVLCSEEAGTSSLITHGENGFVFPSHDPDALACLLREVREKSPGELREIGARARRTVADQLHPGMVTGRRLAIYAALRVTEWAPHPWLNNLLGHSDSQRSLGILDSIPMKRLTEYSVKRMTKKARASVSGLASHIGWSHS